MFKNADLLFLQSIPDELSQAIVDSTVSLTSDIYDHVALVEVTTDNQIFILHTLPSTGSIREPYSTFKTRNWTHIDLFRANQKINAPQIIQQAKQLLNQPYNASYIPGEQGYYCADFIYYAFENNQIFKLIPMNFSDQTTGAVLPYWLDYYSKLALSVPNDQPGLNPNTMLHQQVLHQISRLK